MSVTVYPADPTTTVDIEIFAGATLDFYLAWAPDGTLADLTGYTGDATIERALTHETVDTWSTADGTINFGAYLRTANNGQPQWFNIHIRDINTAGWPPTTLHWTLHLVDGASDDYYPADGLIRVRRPA